LHLRPFRLHDHRIDRGLLQKHIVAAKALAVSSRPMA